MIVLGYWDNGIRHMTNSKRPITKVDGHEGPEDAHPARHDAVDIMQALGAEAQQIKFAELYVALQQGVVDGQENPLVNIHAAKLYEVQKYLALTGHQFQMTPFLMSKRAWDKLSDGRPEGVHRKRPPKPPRCSASCRKEADDKLLADLKAKGVQVDTVDQRGLPKATAPVLRQVDRRPDRRLRQARSSPPRAPSDGEPAPRRMATLPA